MAMARTKMALRPELAFQRFPPSVLTKTPPLVPAYTVSGVLKVDSYGANLATIGPDGSPHVARLSTDALSTAAADSSRDCLDVHNEDGSLPRNRDYLSGLVGAGKDAATCGAHVNDRGFLRIDVQSADTPTVWAVARPHGRFARRPTEQRPATGTLIQPAPCRSFVRFFSLCPCEVHLSATQVVRTLVAPHLATGRRRSARLPDASRLSPRAAVGLQPRLPLRWLWPLPAWRGRRRSTR
jgi:hypothetical protein